MYDFITLDLNTLDADSLKEYDLLTKVEFRCCLRGQDPDNIQDSLILAVTAAYQGKPIALALASLRKYVGLVDVHTMFVYPQHRRHHVGTRLLAKLQNTAKQEGGELISLHYELDEENTPAVEKILLANGWTESRLFLIRCFYDAYAFQPPWFRMHYTYPPSWKEVPWTTLSHEEMDALRLEQSQHSFPAIVSPFNDESHIAPFNSLVLKSGDEIIGWIITHSTAQDTIRYSALYIRPRFHFFGYAIKLLVDAIYLQKKSPIQWAFFELPIVNVRPSWVKFIQRRLIPYADKVTRIQQAWRIL
jgi:GNAT superfamily N-acetyltransferase